MDWLREIFVNQTFIQAILILSLICAVGLALGGIKIKGVSLGVTFVFFTNLSSAAVKCSYIFVASVRYVSDTQTKIFKNGIRK